MSSPLPSTRSGSRGMTLLEVMISLALLSMISLLLYGTFDALSRGRQSETDRSERNRQGWSTLETLTRDLSSAYLSAHQPFRRSLITRITAFVGHKGGRFDRVDFAAFAHQRTEKDAKESDQAEVGYFAMPDPAVPNKIDLVRREQTPPDMEPTRGGGAQVIAEDIDRFALRYLDPTTGQWVDSWDSTQATGQRNRLPWSVQITLTLKGKKGQPPVTLTTKTFLPIQRPLSFAP